MSDTSEFPFDTTPRIDIVDRALGETLLTPETIGPYYEEALGLAVKTCTEAIEKYSSGSLEYTRAVSKPVEYVTMSGEVAKIGLGLTAGPAALWDATVVEMVELGIFVQDGDNDVQFQAIAELRGDRIKSGSEFALKTRINNPEDLDSFMRGIRFIAGRSHDAI